MLDEIQTGMGRTGLPFAHQHTGIQPDVMTLAKGLANGVPIGACLARGAAADVFAPGTHGSTFGGNPLAARAGIAAIEMIENEGLLAHVGRAAAQFRQRLEALKSHCDAVRDVRVIGMMIGVELAFDGTPVVHSCLEKQLLVNCTQGRVIRLLPAMNITPQEIDDGCDRLGDAIVEAASRA